MLFLQLENHHKNNSKQLDISNDTNLEDFLGVQETKSVEENFEI